MSQDNQDISIVPIIAKAAIIAGGLSLVRDAFRHRRLLFGMAAAGAAAVYVNKLLNEQPSHGQPRKFKGDVGSPSFPGEHVRPVEQRPVDELEEAGMESFPASDPPASYRRA